VLLSVALFVALEWLWCRPARPHGASGSDRGRRPADRSPDPDLDPFALPFIRRRLDVLASELVRLERDPTVFAKAFRTRAAQSAYDALLADATRLAAVATIEVEIMTSRAGLREELEI
jgi:hypothetical protein